MNVASAMWFRTRTTIRGVLSSTAILLRRWLAGGAGQLSTFFYVLMGFAVALSALCVLIVLADELGSFLRAPLGFKDEPLTGLPSLASVVAWPALGSALVLWVVARYLGSLSARWRCTEHYPETSADMGGLRCWLAPNTKGSISARSLGAEQLAREREELARSRVRALGWGDGDSTLERAVEAAIKEVGASSLMQMGLVIKTARGLLRGERFDEKELCNVVRARLEGKN